MNVIQIENTATGEVAPGFEMRVRHLLLLGDVFAAGAILTHLRFGQLPMEERTAKSLNEVAWGLTRRGILAELRALCETGAVTSAQEISEDWWYGLNFDDDVRPCVASVVRDLFPELVPAGEGS